MTRFTKTLATLAATTALAVPTAALAASSAPAKARPSCATVASKIADAKHLSDAQQSVVAQACTKRNGKIDAARADRKTAREAWRQGKSTRKAARVAAKQAHQAIRGARVEFRTVVKATAAGKTA